MGLQWAGFKQGSLYTGHLPDGFGCFLFQLEGQRVLALADVLELCHVAKPDFHRALARRKETLTNDDGVNALQDFFKRNPTHACPALLSNLGLCDKF